MENCNSTLYYNTSLSENLCFPSSFVTSGCISLRPKDNINFLSIYSEFNFNMSLFSWKKSDKIVITFENSSRSPIEIFVNPVLQNIECQNKDTAIIPVKLFFDGQEKIKDFSISTSSNKDFAVSDIFVTEIGCPLNGYEFINNQCACSPGTYSSSQYGGSCLHCSWNCKLCTDSLN